MGAFEDVIWMAARYANGRSTYAPSMVRDSIKRVQSVDPEWKPCPDEVIAEDSERKKKAARKPGALCPPISWEDSYLDDLFA